MADFIVTTGEDVVDDTDNRLSLREAFAQINAADSAQRQRILFADGVDRVEIFDDGLFLNAPNLVIDGDADGDGIGDVTLTGEVEGAFMIGAAGDAALTLRDIAFEDVTVIASDVADGRDGADGADVNGARGRAGAEGDGGRFLGLIKAAGDLALDGVRISDAAILGVDAGDGGDGGDGQDRNARPRADGDGADGRNGGHGGDGGDGGTGDNVAVIVANGAFSATDSGIDDSVRLIAGDGGNGGEGGAGGDGGAGGAGGGQSNIAGGDGGDGGDGGLGGDGGDGGDSGAGGYAIAGIYFTGEADDLDVSGLAIGGGMDAAAGAAGDEGEGGSSGRGGEGGAGGAGGTFADNGANGRAGDDGDAGADGQAFFAGASVAGVFPEVDGVEPADALVYAAGLGGPVTEGESLTFALVRTGASDVAISVTWTLEGGEGFGVGDVSALTGVETFEAGGPDVIEVEISAVLDDVREDDERFAFAISEATPAEGSDDAVAIGTEAVSALIENARGAPQEVLTGGRGRDVLKGSRLDEDLLGFGGRDKLVGARGEDLLKGGRGKDKLNGGGGDDVLVGGLHRDKLIGGRGDDMFVFEALRHAGRDGKGDRIVDFGRGGDLIDLSGIDADAIARGDQAFAFIGAGDFSETAGELRQNGDLIEGDVNGDGAADFELRLLNSVVMTSDDFVL
ncbi:MAG: hypothetical protein CML43_16995 [Rhodobacteraceae bacterium]|nr:hypothetical protein [Paracoccaceae bacterium]